jgi:hypothetical protein
MSHFAERCDAEQLVMRHNPISQAQAKAMATALRLSQVVHIDLSFCQLDSTAAATLLNALAELRRLAHLVRTGNQLSADRCYFFYFL